MSDRDETILFVRRYDDLDRGQVLRDAHTVGLMTDTGGMELSVDNHGRILLRSNEGSLVLHPDCSNTVHVEVEGGGSGYLADFTRDEDAERDRKEAVEALKDLHAVTNLLCKATNIKTAAQREDLVSVLRGISTCLGRALR